MQITKPEGPFGVLPGAGGVGGSSCGALGPLAHELAGLSKLRCDQPVIASGSGLGVWTPSGRL